MTDPGRRPRVRAPGPFAVACGALGLFFAVLGALAIEDRAGAVASQPVAAAPPPRRVLVRRVIETRIVVHVPRRARVPRESAPATVTAPAPATPPPATPPPATPPPAAAAPAPAPLTTRSS
jgi:hypothetical protein